MKRLNLNSGDRFGKLYVISESDKKTLPSGQKIRQIKCMCDCGNETTVLLLHLVRGRTLSCGCTLRTRNGMSKNPLLKTWRAIKHRTSPNYFERHLYFDKGITVCDEWLNNHMSFIDWAEKNGYKKGLQIDRTDNSKGYSPNNCRWVTPSINVNNRDNTVMVWYNNEHQSLSLLLRSQNKLQNYYTILNRIKRGWLHELAINTPIRKGNYGRINSDNK